MRVHSITHNALCCWQQHVWPDQLFLHREQQQSITDNSPFISAAAPPGGCGSEGGAGIKVDGSEPPPPLVHYFTKVFFFNLLRNLHFISSVCCEKNQNVLGHMGHTFRGSFLDIFHFSFLTWQCVQPCDPDDESNILMDRINVSGLTEMAWIWMLNKFRFFFLWCRKLFIIILNNNSTDFTFNVLA